MYNSYEEYMQNVLGVRMPNTYPFMENERYFEPRFEETNLEDFNKYYPEIYQIVYPMVQKACGKRNITNLDEAQLNEMVEEVYNGIEPGDDILQGEDNGSTPRNGDVKNPRAKETRRKNDNYLLKDLIRILFVREFLQGGWQNNRPPRPPFNNNMMPGNGPRFWTRSGYE